MQPHCMPGRHSQPKYSGIASGVFLLYCCCSIDVPHVGRLGVYCLRTVSKNPLVRLLFLYLLSFCFWFPVMLRMNIFIFPIPFFIMFTHPYLQFYSIFVLFPISSYFSLSLESHSLPLFPFLYRWVMFFYLHGSCVLHD